MPKAAMPRPSSGAHSVPYTVTKTSDTITKLPSTKLAEQKTPRSLNEKLTRSAKQESEYVYRPLRPDRGGKHHIRLVHLLPAPDVNYEICCGIYHSVLEDNTKYEALSYVWGDPIDTRPIQLNSRVHHVTANLFDALRHLREERKPRTLWIDAICINQKDDREKNVQVALMGHIYKQASNTVAWLGPEATAKLAFDFCRGLEGLVPDVNSLSVDQASYWAKDLAAVAACRELFHNRSYWHRLWIVQELCLSSSAFFQMGDIWISFNEFYMLWCNYDDHRRLIGDTIAGVNLVDHEWTPTDPSNTFLARICKLRLSIATPSFTKLLTDFKHQSVTDSRDRVFGLLGLLSPGWQSRLVPDYDIPLRDLYVLTAVELANNKGLEFLMLVEAEDRDIVCDQLPSWVPDFATRETYHMSLWRPYMTAGSFTVSDLSEKDGSAHSFMIEDEAEILLLRGVLAGTVTETIATQQPGESSPIYLSAYSKTTGMRDPQHLLEEEEDGPDNTSWGPCKCKVGDIIIYVNDSSVLPLVLRPINNGFLFVGCCVLIDAPLRMDPDNPRIYDVEKLSSSDIIRGSLRKGVGDNRQLEVFRVYELPHPTAHNFPRIQMDSDEASIGGRSQQHH